MSYKREFAVWFKNVLVDIGPDKDALAKQYPSAKYLILPYCKGR